MSQALNVQINKVQNAVTIHNVFPSGSESANRDGRREDNVNFSQLNETKFTRCNLKDNHAVFSLGGNQNHGHNPGFLKKHSERPPDTTVNERGEEFEDNGIDDFRSRLGGRTDRNCYSSSQNFRFNTTHHRNLFEESPEDAQQSYSSSRNMRCNMRNPNTTDNTRGRYEEYEASGRNRFCSSDNERVPRSHSNWTDGQRDHSEESSETDRDKFSWKRTVRFNIKNPNTFDFSRGACEYLDSDNNRRSSSPSSTFNRKHFDSPDCKKGRHDEHPEYGQERFISTHNVRLNMQNTNTYGHGIRSYEDYKDPEMDSFPPYLNMRDSRNHFDSTNYRRCFEESPETFQKRNPTTNDFFINRRQENFDLPVYTDKVKYKFNSPFYSHTEPPRYNNTESESQEELQNDERHMNGARPRSKYKG